MVATKDQVAQLIVGEAKARNHTREECLGELSALYQESQWDETIWDPTHVTYGVAQQDGSYANRFDGAAAQVKAFFDKLDVKRTSPGHGDIWLNICWLQQAPNWPSAQYWWDHGRQAYLTEIKSRIGTVTPYLDKYWPTGQPAPAPQGYGLPTGSNSGGYGGSGVKFPDWVYQLGNAFGLKPSTYPGHQETDRSNEAGYAPNPQHLNRGIDWAAPGAPDEVNRMQRLAEYLFSIRGELEQVIWWNPDGRKIGVAGGKDVTNTPYYNYPGGYDDHRDHVHTRQSHPIPVPGGPITVPPPVIALRPQFEEREMFGHGGSKRSRQPINFFIHTEEGNGTAESLAKFCDGSNNVSYHYTLRDRIVYDVVDTDLYSWSVLDANVFSINLCFAGSFAGWSREQWMQREGDIEIAAYLAVQDCRKYGIPTDVIAPPYHEAAGISDHKYVTQQLHIGTHTDVGNNFPWDVFARYVTKYTTDAPPTQPGDDMALVPQEQWDRVFHELTDLRQSRSPLRHLGEGKTDTWSGFGLNTDGSEHLEICRLLAGYGHPPTLALLREVASADPVKFPDRQGDRLIAQAILADVTSTPVPQVVNVTNAAAAIPAAPVAVPDTRELDAAYAENARLRDENARLQAAVVAPVAPTNLPAVAEVPTGTLGGRVGKFIDAVGELDLSAAADVSERATLSASIKVLATKNGADL